MYLNYYKNKMERNYELTDNTIINDDGVTLYQIKCIKNFEKANIGELGGYIEYYNNLSDNAWVADNAKVWGNANIEGNAAILGNSEVFGNSVITDNVRISGNAKVGGYARIYDNVLIFGNSNINRHICIYDTVSIGGNAIIDGSSSMIPTDINNNPRINYNAFISNRRDYMVFDNFGSRNDVTTIYKAIDGVRVQCGCFNGLLDEFKEEVIKTHVDGKYALEYLSIIETAKIRFNI